MFTQEEKIFIANVLSQLSWKTEQIEQGLIAKKILAKIQEDLAKKQETKK